MAKQKISVDLKKGYDHLYKECALVTLKWQTLKALFGHSRERLTLLDETANGFFQVCEDTFLNDIFVSLSRLTDTAQKLSLRKLLSHLDKQVRSRFSRKLKPLIEIAEKNCDKIRTHRNRRIGHIDESTVLTPRLKPLPSVTVDDIDKAIESVQTALRTFSLEVLDEDHMFFPILQVKGVDALVNHLERGLRGFEEDYIAVNNRTPPNLSFFNEGSLQNHISEWQDLCRERSH
jgi:hypothetical protein